MNKIGENIRLKRKEKGFNQAELAKELGVTSQAISQYEKGLAIPKHTVMEKLKSVFKYDFINDKAIDLSIETNEQLSQKGNNNHKFNHIAKNDSDSLKDAKQVNHNLTYDENSTFPDRSKRNQDEAPYLENVNASAGLNFLTNNGDATSYIKIPGAGVDAYINVFGDSMYPKYCAGEIIGVKQVQKDDLFFGHAFVVQMSDGEAYIKYIQPGKDEDHWSLESENPKYPPRQFHLSKINKIFKIKTTVTKNSL